MGIQNRAATTDQQEASTAGRDPQLLARPASTTASESIDRLEELSHVLRARTGVEDSFGWLLNRHGRPLLYYLRRLVRNPEAALDLHQEVWLAVFRGLPGLRRPGAFRGWLYSLAHNKAVHFLRKELKEAEKHGALSEEAEQIAGSEPAPLSVHRALSKLPAHHREVLTLHYLRELSLEEIAFACGLPLGTVKSRLHNARAAMRRELMGGCYD